MIDHSVFQRFFIDLIHISWGFTVLIFDGGTFSDGEPLHLFFPPHGAAHVARVFFLMRVIEGPL